MIELQNVSKIYNYGTPKAVVALEDVNLQIEKGELVLLMGPSGSGKSTLLSLIAALTRPTKGVVKVKNRIVSKLPDHFAALYRREWIGFIFQRFNLIEELSVLENVLLPLVPTSWSIARSEERAWEAMRRFAIEHKAHTQVSKLSGGERQRVAIARSLVLDPPILLADEPTANLDSALAEQFLQLVQKLHKQGKTILVATHDPRFESFGADRRIKVEAGHVFYA